MITTAPSRTMTVEEWAAMEEDEPGELVDGQLEEEEMPDPIHDVIVGWLIQLLRNWMGRGRGFVGASDTKFRLGPRHGRKPDAWAYLPGGRIPPARGPVSVPPDIMIEVVSRDPRDGRRDRVVKLDEYARFGVRYYWIVDPAFRTLEIWELLPEGRYARAVAASSGAIERVPGCDLLRIDIDELWAEVDRLGPEEAATE